MSIVVMETENINHYNNNSIIIIMKNTFNIVQYSFKMLIDQQVNAYQNVSHIYTTCANLKFLASQKGCTGLSIDYIFNQIMEPVWINLD